jgi:hypothetical protein
MKIKITNAEAMNLFNALTQLNVPGNAKFTYIIAKNRALLKPHIEALQEASQQYDKNHPELKEYRTKVDDLLRKFAVDKDGKPVTRMSGDGTTLTRIIPPEKQAAYIEAREALDAEYRAVLTGFQLHQEDFANLLRKEEDFDLRMLAMKDLPEGALNTQVMNLIFVFVEEDKGEVLPLREARHESPMSA